MKAESNFFINKNYEYKNRFDLERFIQISGSYFDILNSPILDQLKLFKTIGTYTINEYPYRPDALSYNIYKDSQYWPYILLYNGISNVMDLTLGLSINFFSLDDLEKVVYKFSNYNKKL